MNNKFLFDVNMTDVGADEFGDFENAPTSDNLVLDQSEIRIETHVNDELRDGDVDLKTDPISPEIYEASCASPSDMSFNNDKIPSSLHGYAVPPIMDASNNQSFIHSVEILKNDFEYRNSEENNQDIARIDLANGINPDPKRSHSDAIDNFENDVTNGNGHSESTFNETGSVSRDINSHSDLREHFSSEDNSEILVGVETLLTDDHTQNVLSSTNRYKIDLELSPTIQDLNSVSALESIIVSAEAVDAINDQSLRKTDDASVGITSDGVTDVFRSHVDINLEPYIADNAGSDKPLFDASEVTKDETLTSAGSVSGSPTKYTSIDEGYGNLGSFDVTAKVMTEDGDVAVVNNLVEDQKQTVISSAESAATPSQYVVEGFIDPTADSVADETPAPGLGEDIVWDGEDDAGDWVSGVQVSGEDDGDEWGGFEDAVGNGVSTEESQEDALQDKPQSRDADWTSFEDRSISQPLPSPSLSAHVTSGSVSVPSSSRQDFDDHAESSNEALPIPEKQVDATFHLEHELESYYSWEADQILCRGIVDPVAEVGHVTCAPSLPHRLVGPAHPLCDVYRASGRDTAAAERCAVCSSPPCG